MILPLNYCSVIWKTKKNAGKKTVTQWLWKVIELLFLKLC